MMMSQDPFETDLNALLQDYAAPIEDDGFSLRVVTLIEKQAKLRRRLLLGSYLLGGLIVGSKSSQIADYLARSDNFGLQWPIPEIPLESFSSGLSAATNAIDGAATGAPDALIWGICGFMGVGMILWLAKDWLESHI